jgi:undecaprenyl-diphosphatase
MSILEAIILGLLQGLTEFLPISSDGHLELGKILMDVEEEGLAFIVIVHLATVCSTVVVFWKDIRSIVADTFGPIFRGKPQWNDATKMSAYILVSMSPVVIAYLLLGDEIESLFSKDLLLVGFCLLGTALILLSTAFVKVSDKRINMPRALVIGVAQAVAMLPGVSRSGSTISAGLLMGINKDQLTRFSFLMVLLPIIGGTFLELRGEQGRIFDADQMGLYLAGFVAAFLSGMAACKLMISIVRRGRIAWFAVYCALVGLVAIGWSVFA